MDKHKIFAMPFASVYPLYVQKAEKKGRTKQEVNEVICWLTGYSPRALADQVRKKKDFETFFREAPKLHPNAVKITGLICGIRIEEIEDPLMRKIRCMDKLVDELAKGRAMEKILRGQDGDLTRPVKHVEAIMLATAASTADAAKNVAAPTLDVRRAVEV